MASNNIFEITEVRGDLFLAPSDASLAHCVSSDLQMSLGIALEFRRKFGGISELMKQPRKVGNIVGLNYGSRTVFHMITKECYWNKPTYSNIKMCLICVVRYCIAYNIKHLCIPRIGCGLDGKKWGVIKGYIQEVFANSGMLVTVYSL